MSTELRDLESKRQRLQAEISTLTHKIESLKLELQRQQSELDRLKLSVEQVNFQLPLCFHLLINVSLLGKISELNFSSK